MENLSTMLKNLLTAAKAHKPLAILIGAIVLIFIIFLIVIFQKPSPPPNDTFQQEPFHVVGTSPNNGQTDVYPGEIFLTFTTDVPVIAQNSFSLEVKPELKYPLKLTTQFPNTTVGEQVLGGLEKNTQYTVTVLDKSGSPIYSWSFTTSGQQPESSTQLVKDQEQQLINEAYPLFNYIPYANNDFSIDYTGRLTLEVVITNSDVPQVKQEVLDWIRSHGVDPATHKIIYKNNF